jgi:hypothetical protein
LADSFGIQLHPAPAAHRHPSPRFSVNELLAVPHTPVTEGGLSWYPYGQSGITIDREGDHTFSSLFVDHSIQHVAPTLAALTIRSAPTPNVVPSDSLSAHSRSLALKAIDMGLMQPNPKNPRTNQTNYIGSGGRSRFGQTMDARRMDEYLANGGGISRWTQIPEEEVHAARAFVRQSLHQSRTQRRSE